MRVFIENEAGSDKKNIYHEKTLDYKKAVTVSRKYPYPYGFILDTTSGDGDNVDAFVITDRPLKSGEIVECEPIGLMEQIEKTWDVTRGEQDEVDHNVLAVLLADNPDVISDSVKTILTDFVLHVFDHIRQDKVRVGGFLDRKAALKYIASCRYK